MTSFGGGGGGGRRRDRSGKKRGSDLRYDLEITLEEAAEGVEKELEIEKYASCGKCSGSGSKSGQCWHELPAAPAADAAWWANSVEFSFSRRLALIAGVLWPELLLTLAEDCGGDGRKQAPERVSIRIPAGVDDGTRLRSTGKGDAGMRGGAGRRFVRVSAPA